jgi:hypothetical protein
VFFCSHGIDRDDPTLLDIAPTTLRLFGIEPPPYMEGRSLFEDPARLRAEHATRGGRPRPGATAEVAS